MLHGTVKILKKKKKKGNERIEINPEKGKTKQNFVAKPTLS